MRTVTVLLRETRVYKVKVPVRPGEDPHSYVWEYWRGDETPFNDSDLHVAAVLGGIHAQ